MTNSIEEQGDIYNAVDLAKHVFEAGFNAGHEAVEDAFRGHHTDSDTEWQRYLAEQPMSTTDLWNALEDVLRKKGASDAWLRYAMPDLHTMAMQFGLGEFYRGYVSHERDEGCGAYDPPRVGNEFADELMGDASIFDPDAGDR